MAFEESLRSISLPCAVDLSGALYHAVKVDSNGFVVLAQAADANVIGILQNNPNGTLSAQGEAATVGVRGISKAHASAAITTGADVGVGSTDGQVAGSATNKLGTAIVGATAANTYASVLLS